MTFSSRDAAGTPSALNLDWLSGGGEMGALIRSMDWSLTPLGPFETWPQSLRTTVSLCLSSTFPILIAWGPERVQIYNDSYRPITGAKHPQSMGQRFNECWASALPAVGAVVDRAQNGEGSYIENLQMFLDRHGYLEEAFMTFSFSPIRDESGRVGGLFHPITEVTDKMIGTRRTQALREMAAQLSQAKTLPEAWSIAASGHASHQLDLPFLLFYRIDDSGSRAVLDGAVGLDPGGPGAPPSVDLAASDDASWPLARALASRQIEEVTGIDRRWPGLAVGPFEDPPHTAMVLPLQPSGMPTVGFLVAGVSSRRALDGAYRAFFETLSTTFTNAVASVRAYEHEQHRAEELAILDRAKTAFFSNVSHEFRTPLTLILGPTEEALAQPEPALRGDDLSTVYRNELRLLKLVNTLLDFSRIEAGRVQASYEPTDLAGLTTDLASAFRSLVERAGLALIVDCPPLPAPVWVDREMWEKVVLNLLSNAFKFTFAGSITVRLAWHESHVEFSVRDTGTGVPEAELPRLFERFHRVEGSRGRSYEGSGIGLALVQELVRLHGGSIHASSQLGAGTTFTIALPTGSAHLPAERVLAERTQTTTATGADVFVREASVWLGESEPAVVSPDEPASRGSQSLLAPSRSAEQALGRVLVADDNADMRDYVRRLLAGRFVVETVADGRAALAAVRASPPDLVVSDVMMPVLDGFGFLRELRADPAIASVPVILLSARAGDEAKIEGIQAGASDYLVKPFSSRELFARVEGNILTARARARLSEVLESMGDAFYILDRDWRFVVVNASHEQMTRTPRSEQLGRSVWEVFPGVADPSSPYWTSYHRCMEERTPVRFVAHYAPLDAWTDVRVYPAPEGIAVFVRDVSEEKRAEELARKQAEFEQQLVGIVSHDLRSPLSAIQLSSDVLMQLGGHDERMRRSVTRIRTSTDRAMRMVRDLLDFTQARLGGGIRVVPAPLDLHTLVRQTLDEVQASFPERSLRLETSGSGRGSWDADRLAQVITNLTTNAFKYSPPGTLVTVASRGLDGAVELRVHNASSPIPPDALGRIFEPMQRANQTDRASRSVGLGLYIVKHIVEVHGGSIEVTSNDDGTTFTVRLPRTTPV